MDVKITLVEGCVSAKIYQGARVSYLKSEPEGGMSILASTVAICLKTFFLSFTSRVSADGPPVALFDL